MLNSAHNSVKLFSFRLAATTNSTRCSCTLFVLQAILALSPGFLTVTPARLLRAKCKGCRGTFCKGCHGTGHLKARVEMQNKWALAPVPRGIHQFWNCSRINSAHSRALVARWADDPS